MVKITRARDVATQGGLVLITKATFTNATQTDVTNCFSSIYDNYKIIFDATQANADYYLQLQLLSGTTPTTSGYYSAYTGIGHTGNTHNTTGDNTSSMPVCQLVSSQPQSSSFSIDIINPFVTRRTRFLLISSSEVSGQIVGRSGTSLQNTGTSFTGFRLTSTSTNTFGGTVSVYGYKNN